MSAMRSPSFIRAAPTSTRSPVRVLTVCGSYPRTASHNGMKQPRSWATSASSRRRMRVTRLETRREEKKLQQRDQIDLERRPFRKLRHADRGPGWLVIAEGLGVDRVQRLKVREIGQVDRRLEDAAEVAARFA